MSRNVTVAATQMACSWDLEGNIEVAERLVREAAAKGAQIILIQELFEAPYFCQKPNPDYLQLATTVEDNVAIKHFQKVAKELQVVLPISFYELAGRARFNSIAIIDADGSNLGIYRKATSRTVLVTTRSTTSTRAIPASRSGIPVTRKSAWASAGTSGSQAARSMALQGAEILFYPTAIGSRPHDKTISSRDHWQRVQQGHAGANLMPLIASNRIGNEEQDGYDITFMVRRSSPTSSARRCRNSTKPKKAFWFTPSTSKNSNTHAARGAPSATAALTCMVLSKPSTDPWSPDCHDDYEQHPSRRRLLHAGRVGTTNPDLDDLARAPGQLAPGRQTGASRARGGGQGHRPF